MIKLDINLSYLTDHYNIGAQRLAAYRGKSITEIMKIESERGNEKAANFLSRLLSNPEEIIKIFQLLKPENRYEIINHMNMSDKIKLLSKLDKHQKLMGLKFFNKRKLTEMMENCNKVDLFTVGLQRNDYEDFIKMIPEKQMDKFFDSDKIKAKQILAGVQYMQPEQMELLISNVSDVSTKDCSRKQLFAMVCMMDEKTLKKSVKMLPQKHKGQLIADMAKEDPGVLDEMPVKGFTEALYQMEKEDLLKSIDVLPEEDMMDMLSEMPEQLMAITASQIPAEEFSKILINDFAGVISDICL